MEELGLYGLAILGTLFWVVNVEALAVLYAGLGWHPLLVALVCAFGQCTAHVVLYLAGARLAHRWSRLDRVVERARARLDGHASGTYLGVAATAGLLGVPPLVAIVVLAPSFGVRLLHLLPIAFATRTVRFGALAVLSQGGLALVGL
jgi:membrane protein YqaA with SNARE-associated domain